MIKIIKLQSTLLYFRSALLKVTPLTLTYLFLRTKPSFSPNRKRGIYASCLFLTALALYSRKLAWKVNLIVSFFFLLYFENKLFAPFNPCVWALFANASFREAASAFNQAKLYEQVVKEGAQKLLERAIEIATTRNREEREKKIKEIGKPADAVEQAVDKMKQLNLKKLVIQLREKESSQKGLASKLPGNMTVFGRAIESAERIPIREAILMVQQALLMEKNALVEEGNGLKVQELIENAQEAADLAYLSFPQKKKQCLRIYKKKEMNSVAD